MALQIWETVITSPTAGNDQSRQAQNATATIVRANSMLQLTRTILCNTARFTIT
ncbi:hypothetical protein OG864_04900 [Streptomyces sp. NBC_00124]|uniref:hypothetical protein n=1 Tax=Streptomyces sp. NBC_00124 TaxID=2975662 RepID=UPI002250182A|nr:hypothetical protein [Streptomyces sp. NBC_00124]MCX5358038.1 hypothetical protein [Streptomyces sp. NBC_00124]